jgi:predicted N-acetyltransferase YhbS
VALRIELLRKGHRREDFDCGKPPLNEWLHRFALQQQDNNNARTRVVVDEKDPGGVLGYYSLLPYQLDTQHFPAARKLPQRLPCLLLGKLAVAVKSMEQGIGALLLADAIDRTRLAIAEVGGIGLFVEAIDDEAQSFYRHFGFEAFRDDEKRLFLNVAWP